MCARRYVTESCVFRFALTDFRAITLELIEIAPGFNPERLFPHSA